MGRRISPQFHFPRNSLFIATRYICLSDFGLSAIIKKDRCHSLSGTGTYLAPEVINDPNNRGHDASVDLWALGIMIFIMLTLECPFYSNNRKELFRMITEDEPDWANIKSRLSSNAYSLLHGVCTSRDIMNG